MWAYESRKRGRTLTSSPEGIPARGHVAPKFRVVANLQSGHVCRRGHVAVVTTITAGPRDGCPPRGSRQGQVNRIVWAHPGGGGRRRLTSMNRYNCGPRGGMEI